ncbi:ubiquitin recognition factor in ER-associated degradation protein 1-like [Oppia nitens]|uniref:ubiquitin recognition factor in ER-associated degradation protein 1-like n=1 Tax=Oppia nitens TaxID=1686743 RepID=UPI0023DC7A2F|nr:ubiquitin recognition factor in ER-associated degradation protein 1-like [Oppia nitens]
MAVNYRTIKLGKLKAFSIDHIGDNSSQRVSEAQNGGKIVLPHSIFRRVYRLEQSPMIFRLTNKNLTILSGVFSFDSQEKQVLVPNWILRGLQIDMGMDVSIEVLLTPLPKGVFVKFEPLSRSFYDITDAKAVLEYCMSMYVCITRDDVISICHNKHIYDLRICETLPNNTIDITECDLNVDFAEMKEEFKQIPLPKECDLDHMKDQMDKSCSPFPGTGHTVSGLKRKSRKETKSNTRKSLHNKRGVPDFDHKIGNILFKRHKKDVISNMSSEKDKNQKAEEKGEENNTNNQKMLKNEVTLNPQTNGLPIASTSSGRQSSQSRRKGIITRSQTREKRKEKTLSKNSKKKKK